MRNTGSGWTNVTTGDLVFTTYVSEGDTTVAQLSVDPSDIMRNAIDYLGANGGSLTYTNDSIDDTGTTVSYTFVSQTLLEVVNKTLELAPSNWYWYIDPATNIFYFKEKKSFADHRLTLGKDIKDLTLEKKADNIINSVYFTGGDTGGGVILYKKYSNNTSIGLYGLRVSRIIDERVTLAATAEILSTRTLEANSSPEVRFSGTLSDSNVDSGGYDLESVNVGDVINVRNAEGSDGSSLWDVAIFDVDYFDFNIEQLGTLYLQVIRKEYTPDELKIYASSKPIDVNKRIEDIKRNLENSQTALNPDAPS
jgi:hypothetical protein